MRWRIRHEGPCGQKAAVRHNAGLALLLIAAALGATPAAQAQAGRPALAGFLAALPADSPMVSVAVLDPATGRFTGHLADVRMHAASTMKIPVLIELVRRIDQGALRWDDSLLVRNRFRSIVDGSPYSLDAGDDSDSTLYRREGQRVSVHRLAELMIQWSSNLATDLLIDRLDPVRVNATAHALGADSIEVRRGVEDGKAYAAGLNNTTTARDLAVLLGAIVSGRAASPAATDSMVQLLLGQEFNAGIPAGLPAGVRVAHKTGDITGIHHDAAIVFPPSNRPFVLVVMTRGYPDGPTAEHVMAEVARRVYADETSGGASGG